MREYAGVRREYEGVRREYEWSTKGVRGSTKEGCNGEDNRSIGKPS
jgi:hypothetical protein